MKKTTSLLLLSTLLLFSVTLSAQTKSCCSTNATSDFAMLGADVKFMSAHLSPEPINFTPTKGADMTFPVNGGKEGNGFLVKAASKSDKYLFIFHEWWGLNDHMRKEAERFSADFPDVNILLIDLYDGQLATNAEDAGKIMGTIQQERAEAIIKGAITYSGSASRIQTLGWCFGGGWSLQAAIILGKQANGCVMYYGMPEKDAKKLSALSAPVLGIFALRDGWITKSLVEEFEMKMKELNKPVTISWFDADHAFANPSNPKFDEGATSKARSLTVEFLKGNFGK